MKSVRAVIRGDIQIFDLPCKSLERLVQAFTLPNPKYNMMVAYKRDTTGTPEFIQALLEHPDGSVRVPRGAIKYVRKELKKDDIGLSFEDDRSPGFDIGETKPVALRGYQKDGIEALGDSLQGSIVIGCGGGKTRLGVAAVGLFRRSTIILVHTSDLLDQWVASLQELLGIEAGVVADGKAEYRPVTVAIIDTLAMRIDRDAEEIRRFGACFVDESHHAPAKTYQVLLPLIPARIRLGLTATPEREDRLTKLMDWSFGDRLLEMPAQTLIKMGYLMRPSLEVVESGFFFNTEALPVKRRSAALAKAIVGNEQRNAKICDIAARDVKAGETVVILSNHRAHCRTLGRMCWERGVEALVLVSGGSSKKAKKARQDTLDAMREGRVSLIVATSLFDEGINIDRLSRVLFALPQAAMGSTEQKAGRLMRLFDGKKPKLYDIVDSKVETLSRRWQKRRRVYKRLGMI